MRVWVRLSNRSIDLAKESQIAPVSTNVETNIFMNEKATFKVRESASYGRACAGCHKAKCKCILRGPGLSCERCHRLQQACEPSTVVRKRLARKTAYRTAHLEERLDDLVGLLESQASDESAGTPREKSLGREPSTTVASVNSVPLTRSEFVTRPAEHRTDQNGPRNKPLAPRISQYSFPAQHAPVNTDPLSGIEPSESQAEQYLATFQQHLNNFPFYCIASTTT